MSKDVKGTKVPTRSEVLTSMSASVKNSLCQNMVALFPFASTRKEHLDIITECMNLVFDQLYGNFEGVDGETNK